MVWYRAACQFLSVTPCVTDNITAHDRASFDAYPGAYRLGFHGSQRFDSSPSILNCYGLPWIFRNFHYMCYLASMREGGNSGKMFMARWDSTSNVCCFRWMGHASGLLIIRYRTFKFGLSFYKLDL